MTTETQTKPTAEVSEIAECLLGHPIPEAPHMCSAPSCDHGCA